MLENATDADGYMSIIQPAISPVFGMIEPEEIVNFMKENVMNDVNMQIQLHKIIWSPDKKGV